MGKYIAQLSRWNAGTSAYDHIETDTEPFDGAPTSEQLQETSAEGALSDWLHNINADKGDYGIAILHRADDGEEETVTNAYVEWEGA